MCVEPLGILTTNAIYFSVLSEIIHVKNKVGFNLYFFIEKNSTPNVVRCAILIIFKINIQHITSIVKSVSYFLQTYILKIEK